MEKSANFFQNIVTPKDGEEIFEVLHESSDFIIERICSNNAQSPSSGWYEQDHNEWVIILQGSAIVETLDKQHELFNGDSLFIPAFVKHKVTYTSSKPFCIWLAVHSKHNTHL